MTGRKVDTMISVKMNTSALRSLMGESFNHDEYERGRKDTYNFLTKQPELSAPKIEEVKQMLQNGEYRNCPGPSYWIGCLAEFDFI
jgi:hypothetical protein